MLRVGDLSGDYYIPPVQSLSLDPEVGWSGKENAFSDKIALPNDLHLYLLEMMTFRISALVQKTLPDGVARPQIKGRKLFADRIGLKIQKMLRGADFSELDELNDGLKRIDALLDDDFLRFCGLTDENETDTYAN